MGSVTDLRQHPRLAIALTARVRTSLGVIETVTVNVSRSGLRAHIVPPPPIASEVQVIIDIPDGTHVTGTARCRARLADGVCGLELYLVDDNLALWNAFIDQEEATGGLWRMIGRAARAPDDALASRRIQETVASEQLQFHTVGENGEAYRLAFQKHPVDAVDDCDLVHSMPGFRQLAGRLVAGVLRGPLTLKLTDDGAPVTVRVAKIQVGGYAWIQSDGVVPASLIALTGAELLLVARNGSSVFPHFTPEELERIACDTFRNDMPAPAFNRPPAEKPEPAAEAPKAPTTANSYEALRQAQSMATDVQIRRYGEKDIFFYPSVWARIREDGAELLGPTMHDGLRMSILALIGARTPRVVQVDKTADVSMLKPPGG